MVTKSADDLFLECNLKSECRLSSLAWLESYLNQTKIAVLYTNHTVMVFILLFVSCCVDKREKQQQQQHHISMQHATHARWNTRCEIVPFSNPQKDPPYQCV